MRAVFPLLSVLLALFAPGQTAAQVYKWVDERGVTHYSNAPPANIERPEALVRVEDKVSLYTPDKATMEAIEAAHRDRERALLDRVGSLERQLDAERRARQSANSTNTRASQTAYEQCLAERRVDCSEPYYGSYPYVRTVVVARRYRSPVGATLPVSYGGSAPARNSGPVTASRVRGSALR